MKGNGMKKLLISVFAIVCLLLGGCTVVPIEEVQGTGGGSSGSYQGDASFDPAQYAADNWEKIVQNADEKANPMSEVLAAYNADSAAAGGEYGVRALDDDTSPWNFIVKDEVVILEVNRDSKKGRMSVDMEPFDGEADYIVQVGPIYSGSAIRDSAEFIKFGDFKNQITYGDLAKALNKHADENVVTPMDFDGKAGEKISITGVFADDKEVLVMPIEVSEVE